MPHGNRFADVVRHILPVLAFGRERILFGTESQTAQLGTFTTPFAAVIHHRDLSKKVSTLNWLFSSSMTKLEFINQSCTSRVQLCNLGDGTVNVNAWFQTGWHVPFRHSVFFFFNRFPLTIRYNLTNGSINYSNWDYWNIISIKIISIKICTDVFFTGWNDQVFGFEHDDGKPFGRW